MSTNRSRDYGGNDSWDQIFSHLQHKVRRQLILTLSKSPPGTWVSLPDAANPPLLDIDRDSLNVSLFHNHLPALEASGFIEVQTSPLRVTHGSRFEEIEAVLGVVLSDLDRLPTHLAEECMKTKQHICP